MSTVLELIRYGFAGYLLLITISIFLYRSSLMPRELGFYESFGTVIAVVLLIIGPIVGFLIHQIYFLYFETIESYNKLSRKCLRSLYLYYKKQQKKKLSREDERAVKKSCYLVWKYMMTGVFGDIEVSDIILNRLRSLRSFSHAFGAIVASGIFSLILYIIFLVNIEIGLMTLDIIWITFLVLIVSLFGFQRYGLMKRIDEIENGIMLLKIKQFYEGLLKVIETEKGRGKEEDVCAC